MFSKQHLFGPHLFVHLALLSEDVALRFFGEADGDVVDLLLVEHGEGERLVGALVRAVPDEEGTVLTPREITGKMETLLDQNL